MTLSNFTLKDVHRKLWSKNEMDACKGKDRSQQAVFLNGQRKRESGVEGGTAVLSQAETGRLSSQYLSLLSKQRLLS